VRNLPIIIIIKVLFLYVILKKLANALLVGIMPIICYGYEVVRNWSLWKTTYFFILPLISLLQSTTGHNGLPTMFG
jgi:hypothetical protein